MATNTRLVSDEQLEAFQRDGYVMVDGLLTKDELDRYGELVTEAVLARTAADDRPMEERSRYQQMFLQCMNLWEDHPEIAPLTFHQKLGQVAAELLEVSAVRLWHDQALYKLPGGRPTDAHQDHPYWPMLETSSVTAWIPFEGSTHASGAMAFLPGTHTIGLRKFVNIFYGQPEDLLADPEVAGIDPVFVEVPKGAVTFHHGLVVHMANANSTERNRAVHTVIYFPDGHTRGYPAPHFAVERCGIEVGQPIDGDVTPIAYPRDDLPPAPAVPMLLPQGLANKGAAPAQDVRG